MLRGLSLALERGATRANTWVLLGIAGVLAYIFNFSSLPISNPTIKSMSDGVGLLDLRLSYSALEARQAMQCYGSAGRAVYLDYLKFDVLFMISYGLGGAFFISRLLAKIPNGRGRLACLNLLPLAIVFFDAIEDSLLAYLLATYTDEPSKLGDLAGYTTSAKQCMVALTCLAIVWSLAANLKHRQSVSKPNP